MTDDAIAENRQPRRSDRRRRHEGILKLRDGRLNNKGGGIMTVRRSRLTDVGVRACSAG